MRHSLLVLLAVLAASPAPAQTQPPQGCTAPEYRQFDYWIGDWTVTDSTGTRTYGSNRITDRASPSTTAPPAAGSRSGSPAAGAFCGSAGNSTGPGMVLEGQTSSPTGTPVLNRIAWIPQPDGRVRQLWSRSTDQGKSWQAGFDGWYRKRP